MKSLTLSQPPTLYRSFSAPVSLTPLKPPKNHVSLGHLRNSSSSTDDDNLLWTQAYRRIPPPANWGINFVWPNSAFIVERRGKYSKTLGSGIHLLNPLVNKIADVHSLREQLIRIPLDTVESDDLEVAVEGQLYIKVVNPYLATYGNRDVDLISAVTQTVKTTLPLRLMVEKIIFNPGFDEFTTLYDTELPGIGNFDCLVDLCFLVSECFRPEEFENDDEINKITTGRWGVKCSRLDFAIYCSNESIVTWEDIRAFLDVFISISNVETKMRSFYLRVKRKWDRILKTIEMVREHYRSGKAKVGESGAAHGGGGDEVKRQHRWSMKDFLFFFDQRMQDMLLLERAKRKALMDQLLKKEQELKDKMKKRSKESES